MPAAFARGGLRSVPQDEEFQVEVILLKNVGGLGALGDKVKVRAGYGRNYLVPGGYAVAATTANLEAFEARRAELEREAAANLAAAESRRSDLEGVRVTIARKAGDEGRLFGSVGTADIAAALVAAGVEVAKQEIRLPSGPFRAIGEFEVTVHLHADVDATVALAIVPES
jgi:large subunit ribosomal protein L9